MKKHGKDKNMAEVVITSENFEEEVLKSDKPVMIDFWASWCAPCKMLAPVVAEIAEEYNGQVKVGKVNVDEQMALAREFKVVAIPTVVLIKDGKEEGRSTGLVSKDELVKLFK